MSSWKTLVLRIGEKGPEYGTSSDFKDHLETCFGATRREIERSGDHVSLVALDSGNCNSVRILLRSMTSLLCSKVIQPASLIIVFETLLSSAATTVDEEKGNPSWQAQVDFYIICILSSLPWGGAELAELVAGKFHELLPIKCMEPPSPPSVLSRAYIGKQKHDALMRYPLRIRRLNIFPANKTELVGRSVLPTWLIFLFPFGIEYLIAEILFSQILLLPKPPFKTLYYTPVIMDLCKALPGAFPAVVAGAVRALFEKISDLDMESRTCLILWFSHHLSNFQFICPWEEWAYVLDLPKWAPKRVFVQEVLQREVRLSYWDKIKQSIKNASALEELLPAKVNPAYMYFLEEGKEKPEEHQLSSELNTKFKEKHSLLLDIGSKSFTHLVTVLERYGQVFAKICPDNDKQVMLLSQVSTY
ncbi:hypothetical protein N665_0560s0004 [Sinapis alba]|nr:hypothetical protein N665_0560s0004 [Sinapis alba]